MCPLITRQYPSHILISKWLNELQMISDTILWNQFGGLVTLATVSLDLVFSLYAWMICSHLSRSVTSRTRCSVCLSLSLLLILLLLCTAFSCNCFGVCFLCCIFYFAPLNLSLSLSVAPSTHTFFRTVPILCIFCLLRFLLLLFFDAHTSHWLLFFLSLWPFICPVVVAVCIFFAIFSHLLCSVASFVRSAALNFNLPNEHETCVHVCV